MTVLSFINVRSESNKYKRIATTIRADIYPNMIDKVKKMLDFTITRYLSVGGNKAMTCKVEVPESMDTSYSNDSNVEQSNGRYHQQDSYCSIIRKDERDRYNSEFKFNGQTTWECSRRPIRCPRIDCDVNVAFSSLTHHFLFDHPEVPILSVEPGVKSTLIISFAALSYDTSRCLALLLVSGKLS